MTLFRYVGPVTSFGQVVASNWSGSTYAPTASRAKTNLQYRYKKDHNLAASSKVELPGKLDIIGHRADY